MTFEEGLAIADEAIFLSGGRRLSAVEVAVLNGAWHQQTYEQIASATDYSASYLRQGVAPKLWKALAGALTEEVGKTTFKVVLERKWRQEKQKNSTVAASFEPSLDPSFPVQDWGEAVDVSIFHGRELERSRLKQWIVGGTSDEWFLGNDTHSPLDRPCRLVAVLGMGGIGKTVLSVKTAKEIVTNFQYVIWRSLRNAPPMETLLHDWVAFLSDQQEATATLRRLIYYLQQHSCLLILDNLETILDTGLSGRFRPGYEGYGELLRAIGEVDHQSCLVLTSREKPREISLMEGDRSPVRSLSITGLTCAEGRELFRDKGQFTGTEAEWDRLVDYYAGNPLALKLVAAGTQDFAQGRIGEVLAYLEQGVLAFDDIRDLLARQFDRLSEMEQEVMYWLAINREMLTIANLSEDMVAGLTQQKLPEAIYSLVRRSLIELGQEQFSLQPVVMEYITERFVEQVSQEINNEYVELLNSHALIKATAKDYVWNAQVRLIMQPLIERLYGGMERSQIIDRVSRLLEKHRRPITQKPGYLGGNLLNLLAQMDTDLRNYDFSDLALWQADLRQVKLHQANFRNVNISRCAFAETMNSVTALTFNPDGTTLTTGDLDGQICVWDVMNTKPSLILPGHALLVWALCYSPDGQMMASGSGDKTIRLWNMQDGTCLRVLQGHTDNVWSVRFSPDGQVLASSSSDQTVRLWDVQRGECLQILQGHSADVRSLSFSPDGQVLASSCWDKTIRLWRMQRDQRFGECLEVYEYSSRVLVVCFSPTASIAGLPELESATPGDRQPRHLLASAHSDQMIYLWDTASQDCLATLRGHTDIIQALCFSADGRILASASADQTIRLWDVQEKRCIRVLPGHSSTVIAIDFHPTSPLLISGSLDKTVRLWQTQQGHCLKTLHGHSSWIYMSFSAVSDGSKQKAHMAQNLATSSDDHIIRTWDIQTGQCLQTLSGHTAMIIALDFSPDGQWLVSGSYDHTVRLWNVKEGLCLRMLQGHSGTVQCVAFSPDAKLFASGSSDQTIRLWSALDGQCLKVLQNNLSQIQSLRFSPNGQHLASGGLDRNVRLWHVCEGQCLRVLQGHSGWISILDFSPDGMQLASGSWDQTIRIWDIKNGQCLQVLQGHSGQISSIIFSPDGCTLMSSSYDQTVRIWDIKTGQCLNVISSPVQHGWVPVKLSPDGQLMGSGQDRIVTLWKIDQKQSSQTCIQTLKIDRLYENMNIAGITGLTDAQKITLKALGAIESIV
jgi:WD40 repeat protein